MAMFLMAGMFKRQEEEAKEEPPNFNVENKRLELRYAKIILDGRQFIAENIGEVGMTQITSRSALFNELAVSQKKGVGN